MGLFDLFKKKDEQEQQKKAMVQGNQRDTPPISIETKSASNSIIKYCETLKIPQNIQSLLWFADGPFKNISLESEQRTVDVSEKIRIVYTISLHEEPSVIFSDLPIDLNSTVDSNESIGYYPTYKGLTPQQRYNYVKWLCDTRQPVDIGYVFIFFYGLERHLLYGKYKEAAETVLNLRSYHKHHSFIDYSACTLIGSALLHRDKEMLVRCLEEIDDSPIHTNIALLAKYLLKCDLSPEDVLALRSAVGFKKTNYIKEYPGIFRNHLSAILLREFGRESFPFYDLILNPPEKPIIMFANTSLPNNIRYPNLPSITEDSNFKDAINKILASTHEAVKEYLADQRKLGTKPIPQSEMVDENEPQVNCPYCNKILKKMPKAKKKCPECGQTIYIKSLPTDRTKRLVREDQVSEIEEQWAQYYRTKKIQEYMKMNNIPQSRYDQIHENLKIKHGAEPSEKDIIIELIDLSSWEHANNLDMGLFRNDILHKGQMFKSFGDKSGALAMFLEVCYLDANGPNNCGGIKSHQTFLKEHPPFNPNEEWNTTLAPGIVMEIKNLFNDLDLSMDALKSRYIAHNTVIKNALNIPLAPNMTWGKIEKVLVSEETK